MREHERKPEERDEREASVLPARKAMSLISPDPATQDESETRESASSEDRGEHGSDEDSADSST